MQAVLCLREREALRQRLSCSIAGVHATVAAARPTNRAAASRVLLPASACHRRKLIE